MIKRITAVILVLFVSAGFAAIGQAPEPKKIALRDGFMIDGIDGKISPQEENWYFSVFESQTDGHGVLTSETAVRILPSSMLAKLADAAGNKSGDFRIWGKFTKFHNKNFIYLTYFLPVTDVNQPQAEAVQADANEEKIIPDDVLTLLRPRRIINLAELKKPLSTESDGIIADRTGFLVQEGNDFYFDFDALGRNIDTLRLPLLNSQALEDMNSQQSLSTIPMRFKISAIVTNYKGKNYMLLQRATRAYNHGNFAK